MTDPRFVQIAVCDNRGGVTLHALDERGDVWQYVTPEPPDLPSVWVRLERGRITLKQWKEGR